MKKLMSILLYLTISLGTISNSHSALTFTAAGPAGEVFFNYSMLPLGYGGCTLSGECGGNKVLGLLSLIVGLVLLDGENVIEPTFPELNLENSKDLHIANNPDLRSKKIAEYNDYREEINIQKRVVTKELMKLGDVTPRDIRQEWDKRSSLLPEYAYDVVVEIVNHNISLTQEIAQ